MHFIAFVIKEELTFYSSAEINMNMHLRDIFSFQFINGLSESSISCIRANCRELSFKKGQLVVEKGQKIRGVYIVQSGLLRIFSLDTNGNEKPIDILSAGEICVFSINCVLNRLVYPAWLKIDSASADILAIPAETFRRVYKSDSSVSGFALEAMAKRIYSMMMIIEEVATLDIGSRINNFLVRFSPEDNRINMSHQEIAIRLGTVREVVSRHLKKLENLGLVRLSRMQIEIVSAQELANILPRRAM